MEVFIKNVIDFVQQNWDKFAGLVSQVVLYLGANPDVLIVIISNLFLAIGGIWVFFIKGRKESTKIDLENEKAKIELENFKTLNALELQKKENELKVTSSLKYQKALANLLLEEKMAEIEAKKADIEVKRAEAAAKMAETAKIKKETEVVPETHTTETTDIREEETNATVVVEPEDSHND